MPRQSLDELTAFLAVARERSFTRAAAQLGVSPSSLSQTVRNLEARLDLRLLTRTTRSVALTEAGTRMLDRVGPHLDGIGQELADLANLRARPAGTIRITCDENAARNLLIPKLSRFLPDYPDITVEVIIDYGLVDIVAQKFDAGVRGGNIIDRDMIAVRIGPDMRMVVVAAPDYVAQNGLPHIPRDLQDHRCINLRLPTHGGLYAWEFEKDGQELRVKVGGPLVFNSVGAIMQAAAAGLGLGYIPEQEATPLLADGKLVLALDDWCQPYTGYHLYYPNRRQPTQAFTLLVDALRHRE